MNKIITVHRKNYKVLPSNGGGEAGECTGCAAFCTANSCDDFLIKNKGSCEQVIFQETTETIPQTKPTIQMNLELDLSNCILPVFFSVKNLRLQSLDTALKNQSDAYNVSVKDLPQETIEMLAEELKAEFIRRNTKVAV